MREGWAAHSIGLWQFDSGRGQTLHLNVNPHTSVCEFSSKPEVGGGLSFLRRNMAVAWLMVALAGVCLADTPPSPGDTTKVGLETSETLFTVLTAINACGYDAGLSASDPIRSAVRGEVGKTVAASAEAQETQKLMCDFYKDHQQVDAPKTLAEYVSLALFLGNPPDLILKDKESNVPPDVSYLLGFIPLVQKFYTDAGIHAIWVKHQPEYVALSQRYHEPLAKMLFDTEVYLKLPSAGFLGRAFTVYLEPMGDPAQSNAREYATEYVVVLSPAPGSNLKMDQIRHTYLHFLLDPLAMKYPTTVARLQPLLEDVKRSPMDASFRHDISLLVTECLIRAIEARMLPKGPDTAAQQQQMVERAQSQGFTLTPYFYQALVKFEKDPAGLRNSYADMLNEIDLNKEEKRALTTNYATEAEPDVVRAARPAAASPLLQTAEEKLASGDPEAAKTLAQQAIDQKSGDQGQALFILARVAALNRDMPGAQSYFERALTSTQQPRVIAWSHIYLGRICDLQEDRAAALTHYRAALTASASLPEATAAAQRGIEKPYEPPVHPQQ
jgi:tetratricopeptide (TPR) repeat protein